MIGRAIASEVGAHMTVINGPEIMSKCVKNALTRSQLYSSLNKFLINVGYVFHSEGCDVLTLYFLSFLCLLSICT